MSGVPRADGKRTVLVVVTGTQRRGAEVFGENVAKSLGERGWDVSIVALEQSATDVSIAAEPLVRRSEGISLRGLNPTVVRRLRSIVRTHSPSVVIAGGGATLKYTVPALVGTGTKLVYSSIGEPAYWARGRVSRTALRILLRRPDVVTAVSHATARQLTEVFGVPPDRIAVVHPGVPADLTNLEPPREHDETRVLFVGSLSTEKDPLAAVRVCASVPNTSLRLVGGGPMLEEVRRTASGSAEVVGPVDDVTPHFDWCDVLLLTSRTEGMPGVVLEAMAAGRPVVAFDVGGVAEAVVDGETGFVVDKGDEAAMAEALTRLGADPAEAAAMGERGRAVVLSTFLLEHAVDRFIDALPDG